MKIIWSPTALGDLDRLQACIAEQNPAAADRMYEAVFDSVEKLMQFPARGRPGRMPGTRELVVVGTPFVVPYRLDGEKLEVVAVLHGAPALAAGLTGVTRQALPDPSRLR